VTITREISTGTTTMPVGFLQTRLVEPISTKTAKTGDQFDARSLQAFTLPHNIPRLLVFTESDEAAMAKVIVT
jgi:hypothetical protein